MSKDNIRYIHGNTDMDAQGNNSEVLNIPIDLIDTSWMNTAQRKIFEVLKDIRNRKKHYKEITTLAGYTNSYAWHKCIMRKRKNGLRYRELLESMGVKTEYVNGPYPPHYKVSYIEDTIERSKALSQDEWDMRMFYKDYPRHSPPCKFIVNFRRIEIRNIREITKRYFVVKLNDWKPANFHWALDTMLIFFNTMYKLYPEIKSLSELDRETSVEKILSCISCFK